MANSTFSDCCLRVLNEELEGISPITFRYNPHSKFLNQMAGTYSVSDVRRMIAFKAEQWYGTEFQARLNPNTLLSPYHFESYIAESIMSSPEWKEANQ